MKVLVNPPVSNEMLKQYQDKWIAVRGGQVIASGTSLASLTKDPKADGAEVFYHVPPPSTLYY